MIPEEARKFSTVILGMEGQEEDQDRDGGTVFVLILKRGELRGGGETSRNGKEWKKTIQEARAHFGLQGQIRRRRKL